MANKENFFLKEPLFTHPRHLLKLKMREYHNYYVKALPSKERCSVHCPLQSAECLKDATNSSMFVETLDWTKSGEETSKTTFSSLSSGREWIVLIIFLPVHWKTSFVTHMSRIDLPILTAFGWRQLQLLKPAPHSRHLTHAVDTLS